MPIKKNNNPFAFKAKQNVKKKSSGKRIGKSKPEKGQQSVKQACEIKK